MRPALFCLLLLPTATHAETFREVNGVVSMEAEHFTSNDGYTLRDDDGGSNKAAGWSGDGWMYSNSKTAQRMDYTIKFTKTGTYYVHLRALAGCNDDADWSTNWEGHDNGYHAEFDGVAISGPGIFVKKKQKWWWYGAFQHQGKAVSFAVKTPGMHTFSILRREALSRLDKIVIHDGTYGTDPASTLTGTGPAETVNNGSVPDASVPVDASVPDATVPVDASVPVDAGSDTLRVEAENMSLQVYRIENGTGYASNDKMITLRDGAAGETGTASYSFNGDAGQYDLLVAYFDETDGVASLKVQIDDELVANFDLDQNLGAASASAKTLVRRTVARAHSLVPGSTIRITGVEDPNEPARIDYIELIAVSTPQTDASTNDDAGPVDAGGAVDDAGAVYDVRNTADNADSSPADQSTNGCATTQTQGQSAGLLLSVIICLGWLRRRRNDRVKS